MKLVEENLNVAANTEEVATPQETVETPQEVTVEPTEKVETVKEDVTQTQSFAKRLKEEKSKARDELIAEMYGESHGIHTYAEYQKAVQKAREEQEAERLAQQNIPEEVVQEIIEGRKFRQEWESERKTIAENQRKQTEIDEFLATYPDVKANDIPAEVWDAANKGKSLVDAYQAHENKQLKAKIAEFESKLSAIETNQKNAATSPGSVTGNGDIKGDFISLDTFEANKHDRNWVIKNFNKINESRKHW